MEKTLTLGSLFDGIGGFPYAASFYGIRSLWASEIMPECISVTRRHFPDMVHVGDITQLHGGKLPPVDIITFGSGRQTHQRFKTLFHAGQQHRRALRRLHHAGHPANFIKEGFHPWPMCQSRRT